MKEIRPVTAWYRFVCKEFILRYWDYNHLEDGHVKSKKPKPKGHLQKQSWPKGLWWKEFGYLVDGVYRHGKIQYET